MPTVLQVKGFRFFFFQSEAVSAPHIHIESGDKYAGFRLRPVELEKSIGYDAKEISEVKEIIAGNLGLIMGKWNEHLSQQD